MIQKYKLFGRNYTTPTLLIKISFSLIFIGISDFLCIFAAKTIYE
nr:MAG TPA: hypothetical protein [Caudoviricetes sp.]